MFQTNSGTKMQRLIGEDLYFFDMSKDMGLDKEQEGAKTKEGSSKGSQGGGQPSAYLGPKLWENTISLPFDLDQFGVSDDVPQDILADIMVESNIELQVDGSQSPESMASQVSFTMEEKLEPVSMVVEEVEEQPISISIVEEPVARPARPSIFASTGQVAREMKKEAPPAPVSIKTEVGEERDFLYVESKRAKAAREKEERRRRMEEDFSAEDLMLATVPGYDFDPKKRVFHPEELKPTPIIRKRKMVPVLEENKDDKYWQKRLKNREATRMSREAKRLKENQISMRAAHLERENRRLHQQLEDAQRQSDELDQEREGLREQLSLWETLH